MYIGIRNETARGLSVFTVIHRIIIFLQTLSIAISSALPQFGTDSDTFGACFNIYDHTHITK